MVGQSNILICANRECRNTRVSFGSGVLYCGFCGKKMSSFKLDQVSQENRDLAELELARCSLKIDWLSDKEIDKWPGPIAFEYLRLKEIMLAGNIEASCWKIANLAEVIVAYFFSVILERGSVGNLGHILFIGNKIKTIEKNFSDHDILGLTRALKAIVYWRNTFGVGHGSLSQSKEFYIKSLLDLCTKMNVVLNNFTDLLNRNELGLRDESGNQIIGYDYIYKIKVNSWDQILTCFSNRNMGQASPSIIIQGYNFSGPDVYFQDFGTEKYRNFRQNRNKYMKISEAGRGYIDWKKDPWQVAWLNPIESDEWFSYYRDTAKNSEILNTNREVLVDAIIQFQRRGMHDHANKCHNLYEECKSQVGETEELRFKRMVSKYIQAASLGQQKSASEKLKKLDKLQKRIEDVNQKKKFSINASISISWYEGVYGNFERAFAECKNAQKEIQSYKMDYPLSATLEELELMKNEVYLYSRAGEKKDYKKLMEKCKRIIYLGSKIYNNNPENDRIVDILGFACNLYGDYFTELLEQNEQDIDAGLRSIYGLNQFGLKIRERMFNTFPDDVWAIRGYAWSLHRKGNMELNKNEDEAKKWFSKAEAIRLRGEEKYLEDLGIKEDLVDNYIDYIKYFGSDCEKESSARINFIKEREGDSPRVISLEKKLKDALSNVLQ